MMQRNNKRGHSYLIIISLFTFLFFCSDVDNKDVETQEKSVTLQPKTLKPTGFELIYPTEFEAIDDNLLIIESELEEGKIKVVGLDDYKLKTSFGVSGNGPGEYSDIIQQPISFTNTDQIQIFDFVHKRIDLFRMDNDRNGSFELIKFKDFILPPELMLAQKSAFINDSLIVSNGGILSGFVAFTNSLNDEIRYFNPFNIKLDEYGTREKMYLFDSDVVVNTEKNLIAIAPKYVPELFIIDFQGNIVDRHTIKEYEVSEMLQSNYQNWSAYYFGITGTSDRIFATFIGKTYSEMDELIDNEEYSDLDLTKLYTYDWGGEFINSRILEGGFFPQISIDNKGERLYSINTPSPNSDLVYFELK